MKKIDKQTYLQALGLWHLARQSWNKFEEYDTALNNLVGCEPSLSHISDAITVAGDTLDAALEREGIEVEDEGT